MYNTGEIEFLDGQKRASYYSRTMDQAHNVNLKYLTSDPWP